jgi:hypothetical protein
LLASAPRLASGSSPLPPEGRRLRFRATSLLPASRGKGTCRAEPDPLQSGIVGAGDERLPGARQKMGTPRDLGVNRAPGEGGPSPQRPAVVASAWHRGPGQPASDPIAAWVRAPPVCAPEQRVSQSSSRADVSPCLWWSGVAARGRRPPAMDGRRNGHGRRRSSCGRPSTSDESPRTRLIAGHSRLWTARVTPKRRGEPKEVVLWALRGSYESA